MGAFKTAKIMVRYNITRQSMLQTLTCLGQRIKGDAL